MLSNSRPQDVENSADNAFKGIPARPEEQSLFAGFLRDHDLSEHTRRAIRNDLRKFARWYVQANNESFDSRRIAAADVSGFRDFFRREKSQAVTTVNRGLCSIRKYLGWLMSKGRILANPAAAVKELRMQPLSPKGLDRSQARKLLRETELRGDLRARAVFSLFLYAGCRVSDLVQLELHDLAINERSGHVLFRFGKGGKQRTVPLPLPARKALQDYLEQRPAIDTEEVFLGERGALTDRGVRNLCGKYSAYVGFRIYPHLLRHTFAKQFLADTDNDLVALAQILGHSNINTTSRYSMRSSEDLRAVADRLSY